MTHTWDLVCTVALWIVLVVGALIAFWLSAWWVSAAEGAPPRTEKWIGRVIYATWGGIGVAFVVAAFGPAISPWRVGYMFIWPAAAIGIVIVSFLAGGMVLSLLGVE